MAPTPEEFHFRKIDFQKSSPEGDRYIGSSPLRTLLEERPDIPYYLIEIDQEDYSVPNPVIHAIHPVIQKGDSLSVPYNDSFQNTSKKAALRVKREKDQRSIVVTWGPSKKCENEIYVSNYVDLPSTRGGTVIKNTYVEGSIDQVNKALAQSYPQKPQFFFVSASAMKEYMSMTDPNCLPIPMEWHLENALENARTPLRARILPIIEMGIKRAILSPKFSKDYWETLAVEMKLYLKDPKEFLQGNAATLLITLEKLYPGINLREVDQAKIDAVPKEIMGFVTLLEEYQHGIDKIRASQMG